MNLPTGYFVYNDHLIPYCPKQRLPFTKTDIHLSLVNVPRRDLMGRGMSKYIYGAILDEKNYRFSTFQMAVDACKYYCPEKKWDYPSIEELRAFFDTPQRQILLAKNTGKIALNYDPVVDKYYQFWELMVYLKEQEKEAAANDKNNQQT